MSKRFYPVFLLFLLLTACESMPVSISDIINDTDSSESFMLSVPEGDSLVFLGIAGKRSNPKETIQIALENAARRVAMFYQVSGNYVSENSIGSGAFDYSQQTFTSLSYDEAGSKQYIESLEFDPDTDAIEVDNVFILRTTYRGALPAPVSFSRTVSQKDKKPSWVDNPPSRIGDYEVGLGYAGRHSSMADTCTVSCRNAVFSIIRNLHTISQSKDVLYQGSGTFDYKTSGKNTFGASGSLRYFYVLDTWIDPQTKAVWTLAIAKGAD